MDGFIEQRFQPDDGVGIRLASPFGNECNRLAGNPGHGAHFGDFIRATQVGQSIADRLLVERQQVIVASPSNVRGDRSGLAVGLGQRVEEVTSIGV